MSAKATKNAVRKKVEDIAQELRTAFPDVLVQPLYDTSETGAVVRILGRPDATAQPVNLAEDLTSTLWEDTGVYVRVRTGQEVWCRKSGNIVEDMGLAPGQEPPRMVVVDYDERGITFVCYPADGHTEHDFGEIKPQR